MSRKIVLFIAILFASVFTAKAQTEYWVKVNPADGSYIKLSAIPPVHWIALSDYTTLDQVNHRAFFRGSFNGTGDSLFTLDERTGTTISAINLFSVHPNIIGLYYSNSLNELFGFESVAGNWSLVAVNPTSGLVSSLAAIPGLLGIYGNATIDENANAIIFTASNSANTVLVTLSLTSGNILFETPVANTVEGLQYDNVANKLYTLNFNAGQLNFGMVSVVNGTMTVLSTLPSSITGLLGGSFTFDANHHRYFLTASAASISGYLYSIDATNGQVIASPFVDESNSLFAGNVIQFRYDNALDSMYALHWEPLTPYQCPTVTNSTINAFTCRGTNYFLPSGIPVSIPGVYYDTTKNSLGCDSIITTINLSNNSVINRTINATVCPGSTYQLLSGSFTNVTGNYYDTLRYQAGCDSVLITTQLFNYTIDTTNIIDSLYPGAQYVLPSGGIATAPGTYQSILHDINGCDSIINTILSFRIPDCINLRNAFTPNGDGYNDKWVITDGGCYQKLSLSVYNRWGSLVYHADDYDNDWDGNYDNHQLPDGTYYYVLNVFYPGGRVQELTGNVTLMR